MRYSVVLMLSLALAAFGDSQIARDDHTHMLEGGQSNEIENGSDHMANGVTVAEHTGTEELIPVAHSKTHHHGMPILSMQLTPEERLYWLNYSTVTYFNTPSLKRSSLYLHIVSYLGSFLFLYPFVLVLWNTKHKLYFPALTVHSGLVMFSAINFYIFESSIQVLFPRNAFSTMTTILMMSTIAHWGLALLSSAYGYLNIDGTHEYSELEDDHEMAESPCSTLRGSTSSSDLFELDNLANPHDHSTTSNDAMRVPRSSAISQFFLQFPAFKKITQKCGRVAQTLTAIMNWALFAYFLVYLGTGVATYTLYGQGKDMFNLLAHFIKGGVFLVLGLVTLARYCGAFKQKGWAWNHVFIKSSGSNTFLSRWFSPSTWTMEMVESALILFYGSTNIFLEHLANPGGEWSAKDLQHASIAFIYIGCGLCGVLLERKLAEWRKSKAVESLSQVASQKTYNNIVGANPGFSPNPFPLVTIFWTGYLMSQHDQESALATAIHKQWGNMFVYACAFRVITYLLFMLLPVNLKTLTKPQMPMTELIVAFSLIAGGLIFMESCSPIVHLMEYYGYSPMFTLNLSLGFVTLLMAWQMTVFTFKDYVESRRKSVSYE